MTELCDPPYPPPPRPPSADRAGPPTKQFLSGLPLELVELTAIGLYLALPVFAACVAAYALFVSAAPILLRIAALFAGTTLALLAGKSLLPRRMPRSAGEFLVPPDEQPLAMAFIERVACDIGATVPRRMAIAAGNAVRLTGRHTLLDLVRPARWELLVGLWAWHALTLSEFQALTARTLAPLARRRRQENCRGVLEALVHGQDAIDELAEQHNGVLAPLARLVGLGHRLVTWPARLVGRAVLFFDSPVRHAIEDDAVAVNLAGSDPLVHAILRADFAGATWLEIQDALRQAAVDGLCTRDLYAHTADAADRVREAHNDLTLGEPPTLRGPMAGKHVDVFEPGQRYWSPVWRDYPPPDVREQFAKEDFVPAERDDRPAVELLRGLPAMRERLTATYYAEIIKVDGGYQPLDPATVGQWVRATDTLDAPARYAGCYDGDRRVEPGTEAEREAALVSEPWDDRRLLTTEASLYSRAADRVNRWRAARKMLGRILRKSMFMPTGRERAMADDLEDELRKTGRWLAAFDRWIYVIHVQMAARLGNLTLHDALVRRYESVVRLQPFAEDSAEIRGRVEAFVRRLANAGSVPPYRLVRDANVEFAAARRDLNGMLTAAAAVQDPLLRPWTGPVSLRDFLYSRPAVPAREDRTAQQYGRLLLDAWHEVSRKAVWLHRNGVAELLKLHERTVHEFQALVPPADVPSNTPPPLLTGLTDVAEPVAGET